VIVSPSTSSSLTDTTREQAVQCARENIPVLPRHGLAKGRIGRYIAEARQLGVGAEGIESGDRKPGAANGEVTRRKPQSPPSATKWPSTTRP